MVRQAVLCCKTCDAQVIQSVLALHARTITAALQAHWPPLEPRLQACTLTQPVPHCDY